MVNVTISCKLNHFKTARLYVGYHYGGQHGNMDSRVPILWEVWGDRVLQYMKQMETQGEEADEVCELQHTMLHKKKP